MSPVPASSPADPARGRVVLIDAFALGSIAANTGVGTYTRELLRALAASGTDVRALADPRSPLPPGVGLVAAPRRIKRGRAEIMEHATRLPLDLARRRPPGSVFHNPGFHAPLGVRGPWVQTLLDVIPLVLPDADLAALRTRWRRFGPRYRKAGAVVAISRYVAAEGVRVLGLDPDRIVVSPLGVDPRFQPADSGPSEPPYLLVVSQYSRRKGFDLAFSVIDQLADLGLPHRLKVAGQDPGWATGELAGLRASARHPERIELCGRVKDLVPLYQGASALLMTSRAEGFGLPALEAMACGVPVVSFANTALTELVEGVGVLVDDGDAGAMAREVRRLALDPAWAGELRARGLVHAAPYSWRRTAEVHLDAYAMAAAEDAG